MTKELKEYLILGVNYIQQFSDGNDITTKEYKDLHELFELVRKEAFLVSNKNTDIAIKHVDNIVDKIIIVNGKNDIEANLLALGMACLSMLIEEDVFNGSKKLKFKRLFWSVYNDLEKSQIGSKGFRNSMELIGKIDDYNRSKQWINV